MTSSSRRHDTLRLWQHDARAAGEPLGEHIARRLVADASLLPAVARAAGLEALAPASLVAATDFAHLPLSDAVRHRVLPVHVDGMRYVVLEDPFDLAVRSWCVAHRAASRMRAAMTMPGVVMRTLEDAERHERVLDTTGVGDDAGGTARRVTEISRTSIDGQSDAVVRLVDAALLDALRARASDIHVETAADGLAIRYRIDGVLHLAGRWPGQDDAGQAISRLKVLAGLDIGERRVPQDGRFRARIEGGDVDFRVSVMPSIHGEDAVLRILDKRHRNAARSFTTLGLDTRTVAGIRAALAEPHGMLLVTGPTGSGKSTTLHTALAESDSGERKLITIEDPIEYELPGVLQIPVNEKKGLTFARGLRSILRHDPDTILVGEIRDGETATIAVQAALTGHLVLSSLHANSAFGVLERLLHMGLDPVSVTEALRAIVAQRLVRRVCEACAVHDAPPRDATAAMRLDAASIRHGRWRRGVGCEACRDTGYAGRIAVAEWLKIDDAIAAALRHRAPATELRRIAREGGHVFMNDAAVAAARAGATTLQEVIRVFGIS